jgi:hypothetical protein
VQFKSISLAVQKYIAGHIITRDMAMDAGMPEIAGSRIAEDIDIEPCPNPDCKGGRVEEER